MRVVVDTSVFLAAAFEDDDDSWKVLDLLARGHLVPVFNESSWDELLRLTMRLAVKDRGLAPADFPEYDALPGPVKEEVEFWFGMWEFIVCGTRKMLPWDSPGDYVEDPDDEAIVAAGLDGHAWFLIHRDKDFADLVPLVVIPDGHEMMACSPGEFVGHFPDWLPKLRKDIQKRFQAS